MFRVFACLVILIAASCTSPEDIAKQQQVLDSLPNSCATPKEILDFVEQFPRLKISETSVYPCKTHEVSFGRSDAYGRKSGWAGQAESEFLQLRMRPFDSTTGITANDLVTFFRNRHVRFPHTESRRTETYNGFDIIVSELRHDYDGTVLNLPTIIVPLKRCFVRFGHCYDRFTFGLYPTFPFGQDREEMLTMARRFVDELGGPNLAVKN